MDKINSNVVDFTQAGGPSGPSIGQVYIDLDGTLRRGVFAGQSKASFEAVRQAMNEKYDASGFVHKGFNSPKSTGISIVNDGLWTYESSPNILVMGEGGASIGSSRTPYPVLNIAGIVFDIKNINTAAKTQSQVKFPQAPDGKTTYNKNTGEVITHVDSAAAFLYAGQSDNIEVVTDRVDMWGFESWLEEVNLTNPYVYPNGLIQSQATTMDGITTSASGRPVTYYAVFDGDTGSRGKGLDVTNISFVQLATILANPKNNLYYLEDGRLVQWRLRQRTVAGAGNGDWLSIDASNLTRYGLLNKDSQLVVGAQTQGALDTPYPTGINYWTPPFGKTNWGFSNHIENGVYKASRAFGGANTNAAVNGECYFLVCGTVNRLNQGAYHPSFNPSGSRNLKYLGQDSSGLWYSQTYTPTQLECFTIREFGENQKGAYRYSGYVGSTSGRPDGRFYDAIYADGQGGVCRDMRYSALGLDLVDFAEADQRVKNGTYRGFEKLIFSRAGVSDSAAYAGAWNSFNHMGVKANVGDKVIVEVLPNTFERKTVQGYTATQITFLPVVSTNRAANLRFVVESILSQSVGGSFLQTDVIGNPANIIATPQLANGWQGSWILKIPEGVSTLYTFTRKSLGGNWYRTFTINNGGSWVNQVNQSFDAVTNTHTTELQSDGVMILQYRAFARQTENAVNSDVYGTQAGVGNVFVTDWFTPDYGALLSETLIGKVLISNSNSRGCKVSRSMPLMDTGVLASRGRFESTAYGYPLHDALDLTSPANNSPALKVLNYNVNINQQAFIQYAYTELTHNGTNWGDDDKIHITDNQSTKPDSNGNTVLFGTARLREPLGWLSKSSQPRNAGRSVVRLGFRKWATTISATIEAEFNRYGKTTASNLM